MPEATRCLDELGVAHLHSQAVRRLCLKAMERSDRVRHSSSVLLHSLPDDQASFLLLLLLGSDRRSRRVVQERRLASLLVFSWRRNEKISAGSVKSGFEAVYRSLGDIAIDVPDAVRHLQDFVGRAQHDGLLPQDWLEGLAR